MIFIFVGRRVKLGICLRQINNRESYNGTLLVGVKLISKKLGNVDYKLPEVRYHFIIYMVTNRGSLGCLKKPRSIKNRYFNIENVIFV